MAIEWERKVFSRTGTMHGVKVAEIHSYGSGVAARIFFEREKVLERSFRSPAVEGRFLLPGRRTFARATAWVEEQTANWMPAALAWAELERASRMLAARALQLVEAYAHGTAAAGPQLEAVQLELKQLQQLQQRFAAKIN